MLIRIFIFLIFLVLFFIFLKLRFFNTRWLKGIFNSISVTITGKRGSGKDTIFSYIAYKKKHNCNFLLQPNTNLISLSELNLPGLNRDFLTNGGSLSLDPEPWEKFNNLTFISDAGVYYPNFEDSDLKKRYQSMAYSIAMWRHLYNAPIHFNVQNFDRIWKILREQVDESILVNHCHRFSFYTIVKVTYYERFQDLVDGKKPIKKSLFPDGAERAEESNRFEIISHYLLLPNYMIRHDSRYFRKLIFKD